MTGLSTEEFFSAVTFSESTIGEKVIDQADQAAVRMKTDRRVSSSPGTRKTPRHTIHLAQSFCRSEDHSYGTIYFLTGVYERGKCAFRASCRIRELLQLG